MKIEEKRIRANGLEHHVITWNPDGATTLVCAHGFLDVGFSFDRFARALCQRSPGLRVVSFDWRGHGETEWIGAGGYYHFPDYVLDLDALLPQISGGEKVHLLGHSMGGTAVTMFSGVRSERLSSLTLVEGLGPPAYKLERAPSKVRSWLNSVAKQRTENDAHPKTRTMEDCVARMKLQHRALDDELAHFLVEKSTREIDGQRQWSFDPMHRTTAPMPFRIEIFGAFLSRIKVPTLCVFGEKGFRLPDERDRFDALTDGTFVEIEDVGHMVHWFKPDALAEAWLRFAAQDG